MPRRKRRPYNKVFSYKDEVLKQFPNAVVELETERHPDGWGYRIYSGMVALSMEPQPTINAAWVDAWEYRLKPKFNPHHQH